MRAWRALLLLSIAFSVSGKKKIDCRTKLVNGVYDKTRDEGNNKKPNIVYIMADDLGWNDVGYVNSKVHTPNINRLKRDGIELTNSYMQPSCSASRSAFMTGKYPSNNGLQLLVVIEESQTCLPLEHKIIHTYMKEAGYVTKQVGKWHLGYCDEACLPENRNVSEFRGVNTGAVDYFNWTDHGVMQRRVNGAPSIANIGTHLSRQDARDVREVIMNHKGSPDPLFLWISTTTPHDPLLNTDQMFAVHDFLDEDDFHQSQRRKYLGLVNAFDKILGVMRRALKDAELDNNTVILFTSDNGGANQASQFGSHEAYANNYPLRNGKGSYVEGGTHVRTIYFDPRLHEKTRGTERDFLVHVTDWLPTFVQLSKPGDKTRNFKVPDGDGVSQLANLGSNYLCPRKRKYNLRKEILIALSDATTDIFNPSACATEDGAYRFKDWKLVYGEQYYLVDPDTLDTEWPKPEEWPDLPDITGDNCHKEVNGTRIVRCLFNLADDPSEVRNLYDSHRPIADQLLKKLVAAKRNAVKNVFQVGLGANDVTTQSFEGYLIPRHDYCKPTSDYFALEPIDPTCY
ncbi:arylsulfatase B-like [Watersipora subatra]|uniref:arylsulfatase B-like n=1 Tax=Watersipora subatra TaxID=2589382 RepID=UPI00355B0B8E